MKPDWTLWEKTEDWGSFTADEQREWEECTELFVDTLYNLKLVGVLNIAFGRYATPEQNDSNKFFMNLLNHNNDVQNAVNMWIDVSGKGASPKIVANNPTELNDAGLSYTYISLFAYSFVQNVELFRNSFLKLLNEDTIKDSKGALIDDLGDKGLMSMLNIIQRYSPNKIKKIKNKIDSDKDLRNAISHGLWIFRDREIQWVNNVIEGKRSSMSLEKFLIRVRVVSHFTQCFIWTAGELMRRGFFEP
jgi:hypothetical protein